MRFVKPALIAALAAIVTSTAAAFAWSTDGHGNIRCADGSSATVAEQSDGSWTVTSAGTSGSTGGSFPTEGKAAQYACNE